MPTRGTDVAFALPVPVVVGKKHDIALNVSGLLWNANPHIDHRAYRKHITALCEELRAAGRSVTLFAHVLDNPYADNDVPAIREAMSIVHTSVGMYLPNSVREVRDFLASSRVVVGARMHACLNAISVGTPAVAWSYSRKFGPLLRDIGWPHIVELREPETLARTHRSIRELSSDDGAGILADVRESADEKLELVVKEMREVCARR
jgi:polysaccharide pyruvyl transferase WcaK-like protein